MNRRRWSLLGVAAVIVGAYAVTTMTHRLEHGDTWNVGSGAIVSNHDEAIHDLRDGNTVRIGFTVRNPGRLPVRLEQVASESPDLERIPEPFEPVSLGRGEQVMVWLTLRVKLTNTYPPCSGLTITEVDTRFRVLGMPRTQWLPLMTRISFRAPC